MKIKLLPFDNAVKNAKEQGGILAELTNYTEIIGIDKKCWLKRENKILNVLEEEDYYYDCDFYFPKCCCEVIEDEKSNG